MNTGQKFSSARWWRSRTGLALIGFLLIIAFFLVTEHTAHVFGALPYVLLLGCLLLYFFMHGRHDEHAGHAEHNVQPSEGKKK